MCPSFDRINVLVFVHIKILTGFFGFRVFLGLIFSESTTDQHISYFISVPLLGQGDCFLKS